MEINGFFSVVSQTNQLHKKGLSTCTETCNFAECKSDILILVPSISKGKDLQLLPYVVAGCQLIPAGKRKLEDEECAEKNCMNH